MTFHILQSQTRAHSHPVQEHNQAGPIPHLILEEHWKK